MLLGAILGHQGGWDEMLLVAAPIAALALILWLANRRATRLQEARGQEPETEAQTETQTEPEPEREGADSP